MVQTQRQTRKRRAETAIGYALDHRWKLAAEENRALLDEDPDDLEAANRLGKALTGLGHVKAALGAYRRTLTIDATNAIARKNLARLEAQQASSRGSKGTTTSRTRAKAPEKTRATTTQNGRPGETLRTLALVRESGKSAEFTLLRPDHDAIAELSVGDSAELELTANGVAVTSAAGVTLGHIEPRAGARLKRRIEGGNRYAVVVREMDDEGVTVHIRETRTDPSLVGQASFLSQPARSKGATPRAYTKSSVLRHERAATDDDDDDEEDVWRPRDSDEDELGQRGFSATKPDDGDEGDDDEGDDEE